MRFQRRIFFASFCFLLGSWGSGALAANADSPKPENCREWAEAPYDFGFLKNNVWNVGAAGSLAWSQCIEPRGVDGAKQDAWSWDWPASSRIVYGYPQIATGGNAWVGAKGSDARLPRKIADTQSMQVSYDFETDSTGGYNTAATMWLVEKGLLDKSAIRTEFMIWSTWTPSSFQPGGKKRAEVEIDGRVWEVWAQENWIDGSGVNSEKWTYVAYRSKTPTNAITYDARKLLADAAARKLISEDYSISGFELGNEVMGGRGKTRVKSYTLEIH